MICIYNIVIWENLKQRHPMLAFTTKFKKEKERRKILDTWIVKFGWLSTWNICIRSLKKPIKSIYLGNACKRREKREYENYSTISMIGLFEEDSNLKNIFVFKNFLYQK